MNWETIYCNAQRLIFSSGHNPVSHCINIISARVLINLNVPVQCELNVQIYYQFSPIYCDCLVVNMEVEETT